MSTSLGDASQRDSKSSIALAVLLMLLGILAIALPYARSFGIVRVLAWLIIFDGVTQLVQSFRAQGGGRTIWNFLVALLYIGRNLPAGSSNAGVDRPHLGHGGVFLCGGRHGTG